MSSLRRVAGLGLVVGLLCMAGVAQAQNNAVITAFSNGPVPMDRPLRAEYDQDSEANLRLVPVIEDDLARRGYAIGTGGPLRLVFETDVSERTMRVRDLISVDLEAGSAGGEPIKGQAVVPLFEGQSSPTGRRFTLTIRVFDRGGGALLWQGSARAVLRGVDRHTAFRAMVPALLNYFGRNLDQG